MTRIDEKETQSTLPLFRDEALDAFAKRSYGRPIARMPKAWLHLLTLLASMIAVAAWLLFTSSYSRKETVRGWLAPEDGLHRISVSQGGQIEKILFEQGDFVNKGETIFVLSQDTKLEEGTGSSAELIKKIMEEEQEIQAQIKIETESFDADVLASKKLIEQLSYEKSSMAKQIVQQSNRVKINEEIYLRYKTLEESESASYLEVQSQHERYAAQKQALAALEQSLSELERQILVLKNSIIKRPMDSKRIKSELARRLIELENRRTQSRMIEAQAILSPISGSLSSLEVNLGETVFPQQLLASVLPESSDLFAEVYIPSRAVGFIEPGQPVRVMYEAFPHQRFGTADGQVQRISSSVLRPEEIPSAIGIDEPAYKARIVLGQQVMTGFGDTLPLRPGMALEAEIILEKRSFLQWFLEPINSRREN